MHFACSSTFDVRASKPIPVEVLATSSAVGGVSFNNVRPGFCVLAQYQEACPATVPVNKFVSIRTLILLNEGRRRSLQRLTG